MSTTTANFAWAKPEPFSATDEDLWGYILNSTIDDIDAEVKTATTDRSMADFTMSRATLQDCAEAAFSLGSSLSGAVAVDYRDGHLQYGTITGNISSITVSNWPTTGDVGVLTLELLQGGSGGYTIDLSGYYATNASENHTETLGTRIKIRMETRDGGTTTDILINDNLIIIP